MVTLALMMTSALMETMIPKFGSLVIIPDYKRLLPSYNQGFLYFGKSGTKSVAELIWPKTMTVTIIQSRNDEEGKISVTRCVMSRYADISVFFDCFDRRITLVTLFCDSIYRIIIPMYRTTQTVIAY